jgi:hypothetical protein
MPHLLTAIGPCLLLTMAVDTPTPTTEAITFKAPTTAQGGDLNAIRPHLSPSVSPRSQEAEPFTGDLGVYADRTGAYATAGIFGLGKPDPICNWFRSTGVLLAVVLRRKRLPGELKLSKHIPRDL